jgi:hypothetical protein
LPRRWCGKGGVFGGVKDGAGGSWSNDSGGAGTGRRGGRLREGKHLSQRKRARAASGQGVLLT